MALPGGGGETRTADSAGTPRIRYGERSKGRRARFICPLRFVRYGRKSCDNARPVRRWGDGRGVRKASARVSGKNAARPLFRFPPFEFYLSADVNIQLAGQNSVRSVPAPLARQERRVESGVTYRNARAILSAADASTIRRERRNALILMVVQKESSPLVPEGGRGAGGTAQRVTSSSSSRLVRPLIELFPKDEIAIASPLTRRFYPFYPEDSPISSFDPRRRHDLVLVESSRSRSRSRLFADSSFRLGLSRLSFVSRRRTRRYEATRLNVNAMTRETRVFNLI